MTTETLTAAFTAGATAAQNAIAAGVQAGPFQIADSLFSYDDRKYEWKMARLGADSIINAGE